MARSRWRRGALATALSASDATPLLIGAFALSIAFFGFSEETTYDLELISASPDTGITYFPETGTGVVTNGVTVLYGPSALTADRAEIDFDSGAVLAEGSVFLQNGSNVWSGERIQTWFRDERVEAQEFRAGYPPYWIAGSALSPLPLQ